VTNGDSAPRGNCASKTAAAGNGPATNSGPRWTAALRL